MSDEFGSIPEGWFEGPEGDKALDRAHAYGVEWQREGAEVFGPAYLLEAVAAIRRLRQARDREVIARTIATARGMALVWPEDRAAADAVLALFGQEGQR